MYNDDTRYDNFRRYGFNYGIRRRYTCVALFGYEAGLIMNVRIEWGYRTIIIDVIGISSIIHIGVWLYRGLKLKTHNYITY